ncbi:hypothetical protein [Cupriavidus necator]
MLHDDHDRRLGESTPLPNSAPLRERIERFWVGPVPVGDLFLLLVANVLPVVLIWHALDYVPYWIVKGVLMCGAFLLWTQLGGVSHVGDDP